MTLANINANHVINSRAYLNAWFGALAKMCFYLQSYHVNFLHWTECLTRQCNYFSSPLRKSQTEMPMFEAHRLANPLVLLLRTSFAACG